MNKLIQIIAWSIFFTSACSTNSTLKLNSQYSGVAYEQYIKASRLMKKAESERGSYTKSLVYFEKAQKIIKSTQSKYPSSKIITYLKSNKIKISGLKLNQLQEIHQQLTVFSRYEQEPFSFSSLDKLLILYQYALITSASTINHTDILSKEEISRILTRSIERGKIKNRGTSYSSFIAKLYADIGQKEKAKQFISRVIPSRKDSLLASAYAKIGQKQLAILIANKEKARLKNCRECNATSGPPPSIRLATVYIELDQLPQSLDMIEIGRLDGFENGMNITIITKAAQAYAKHGNTKKAIQLLASAMQKVKDSPPFSRNLDYLNIAIGYANIGQRQKARQVFNRIALKIRLTPLPIAALFSNDRFTYNHLYSKIAIFYAMIGQKDRAKKLLLDLVYQDTLSSQNLSKFSWGDFMRSCYFVVAYAEAGLKPEKNAFIYQQIKRQEKKLFYFQQPIERFWKEFMR